MSTIVSQHLPCEKCGSSDAGAINSDGWFTCFSCGERWAMRPLNDGTYNYTSPAPRRVVEIGGPLLTPETLETRELPARRITAETCERYAYWSGPGIQVANFRDSSGAIVAQKIRRPDKSFEWRGDVKKAGLFGDHLAREGGRRLVITEGEIDALSVSQAFGNKWPVVSVRNGAQGAKRDIAAALEWLETYEEVVLCFDSDEPGQKAAASCAELFSPGKVCIAALPLKDANEMLVAGREGELVRVLWDAKRWRPAGIIPGVDLVESILQPPPEGLTYPWGFLNETLHGMRPTEIVTWAAGSGIGKSTVVRHIVRHLQEAGHHIGVIALEESASEAALAQVSLAMGRRLHVPRERRGVQPEEIKAVADRVLERVWFFDTQTQGLGVESVIPKLRYMAKAYEVRWVVLDHISIMSGGDATAGDERKRIDELMYALRDNAMQLGVGLQIVCHLRKASGDSRSHEEGGRVTLDDLRGSASIKQVSNVVLGCERDQQALDEGKARVLKVRCLKNRFTGETGELGMLQYNRNTGLLEVYEADDEPTHSAAAEAPPEGGF